MSSPSRTFTRRAFVAGAIALPAAVHALAEPAQHPSARWVFLGTDKGKGIYRASWDPLAGRLGAPQLAASLIRPAYMAMHPALPVLYAISSTGGSEAGLTAFHVDAAKGELRPFSHLAAHGDGPCFVAVDRTGNSAFIANYSGGSMTAYHLAADGSLAQTVGVFNYTQKTHGPVADRQEAAHLHCATFSPHNDFVLVCDLGDDVILVFPIAPERASYVGQPTRIAARPGSGPRHLAFHPNGRWLYCIHELDCTIDLYDWSVREISPTQHTPISTLRSESVVSTLRPGAKAAGNTACEILISPDGRFLYSCTRGEDTIAIFRIDPASGLLTEQQRTTAGGPTHGTVPRIITFDPTRRWLLSANQGAPGSVTVFAHDPATGRLQFPPHSFPADTPMFLQFV